MSGWLLFGGDRRVDVKVVVDEGWVNSWSIAGIPCENVNVPFEEFDELFLLLRGQLGPYLKEFLRVAPDDHLLQIFAFCPASSRIKRWHLGF